MERQFAQLLSIACVDFVSVFFCWLDFLKL